MQKKSSLSRLEVWGKEYIDFPERRRKEDQNAVIVQIEPGAGPGEYIVEVVG